MRLEHIAINVPDPDGMAEWYVANLGMRVLRHTPIPNKTYFIADSTGQSVIEIYRNPAAPVPDYSTVAPLVLHFAFNTDDIEADVARLIEAGASTSMAVDVTPAGDKLIFLRDPWQVTVQLVQRKVSLH